MRLNARVASGAVPVIRTSGTPCRVGRSATNAECTVRRMRRRHAIRRRWYRYIINYKPPAGSGRISGRSAVMRLYLIADDLTGALDTAAQFVGATGPVPVHWQGLPESMPTASIALDSGTRDAGRDAARATV